MSYADYQRSVRGGPQSDSSLQFNSTVGPQPSAAQAYQAQSIQPPTTQASSAAYHSVYPPQTVNSGSTGYGGIIGHDSDAGSMYYGSTSSGPPPGATGAGGSTGGDTRRTMVATWKGDVWKVSVVKATSQDVAPPKAKHVRALLQGLANGGAVQDRNTSVGSIFYHMRKRIGEREWVVVAKVLTIWHHIFREGNQKFVEYFACHARRTIDMRAFNGAGDAYLYAGFIRSYSAYLIQWCAMRSAIDFPPGKLHRGEYSFALQRYRNSDYKKTFKELPVVFDTLEALTKIDLDSNVKFSPVVVPTYLMLAKDVTYLFHAVSAGVLALIEVYFESDMTFAKTTLELYKRFQTLHPQIRKTFDLLASLGTHDPLPELDVVSMDLTSNMEEYIRNGAETRDLDYSDEEAAAPYNMVEDYYSASDPEPEPAYAPRQRTPSPSTSSTESESESSSSESEEEVAPPVMPQMPMTQRAFDPLYDLLGMQQMTVAGGGGQLIQYQQPTYTQPNFANTNDARIQSIKAVMNGVAQQRTMQAQGMPGQQVLALPPSTASGQSQYGNAMGGGGGGGLSNVYAQMQAAQMQRQMAMQSQAQQNMQQQYQSAAPNQHMNYATYAGLQQPTGQMPPRQ